MTSTQQKVIRNKVGLLRLAEELGNVSRACQVMGYSRDTFYRYKQAAEQGGFEALVDQSRKGRPNLRNRTASEIEEAIVALATDEPALGQVRVSNELRKSGMQISAAGVRCVWQRHGLETMKKRLLALEKKVAEEGFVLTEARSWRWKRSAPRTTRTARSKPAYRAFSEARTPSTSATSRVSAGSTSRPSSTRTPRWRTPSSTRTRRR